MNHDEEILIEDELDFGTGIHKLHVMGMQPFDGSKERWLERVPQLQREAANCKESTDEAGMFHLLITWPSREACTLTYADSRWPKQPAWQRSLVLWALRPNDRIREQIQAAAAEFQRVFGTCPPYVWMRKLPKGVEWGDLAEIGEGVEPCCMFEVYWMPKGYLAVGR